MTVFNNISVANPFDGEEVVQLAERMMNYAAEGIRRFLRDYEKGRKFHFLPR